jgi:predicted nuclease of predicted toxin-antitoxin system
MFDAEDTEIIARARRESRIVVTADLDYPRLLSETATLEPSVILFRGGNWSERGVIDRMTSLLASLQDIDFERSIIVIDRSRVRIRRLPLMGTD